MIIKISSHGPYGRKNGCKTVAKLLRMKSNSHAPNLLASIIYSRVNKVRAYYFAHANANTPGT